MLFLNGFLWIKWNELIKKDQIKLIFDLISKYDMNKFWLVNSNKVKFYTYKVYNLYQI